MTYNIIFEPDYQRVLPAILIEVRADIPEMKNQIGSVIKSFVDTQLALIKSNTIFYKIETKEFGVIAGVFAINVNDLTFFFFTVKRPSLLMKYIRPAFKQFEPEISLQISNFMESNLWKPDVL